MFLVDRDLEYLLENFLDRLLVVAAPSPLGEEHVAVFRELLDRLDGSASAPTEQVAESCESLLLEHSPSLPTTLELEEDVDRPLGVGRRDPTPALEDDLELLLRNVAKVHLEEAVAESAREHLSAAVQSGRVLRREQHKVRMRSYDFAGFGNDELAIVVEQPIERLEYIGRRQVELVKDDPVASPQGANEDAFLEDELARLRVGNVGSDVLLNVGVLVVVDAHEAVTCPPGEVSTTLVLPADVGP